MMLPATNNSGFTLVEAIIYIGLFSLIFTGIFISIYPIFTGAERLTRNIATEGETAFILTKIDYVLSNTITSSEGVVTVPAAGETSDELILSFNGVEQFHIRADSSGDFCSPPLLCEMLLLQTDEHDALPLNAQRVTITDFEVTHYAPTGDRPRFLAVSFTASGRPVGPVHYFLHF